MGRPPASATSGDSGSTDGPSRDVTGPFLSLDVDREHHGRSLFEFLDARLGPLDRRRVRAAARRGEIVLNGEPVGAVVTLRSGDALDLAVDPAAWSREPTGLLEVLLRRDDLVVGVKPAGLAFGRGGRGGKPGALELLRDGEARPRAVHRLDQDTSGLVVAALGGQAERELVTAFQDGRARMEYLAVVRGRLAEDGGELDVPLAPLRNREAGLQADPVHGHPCSTRWEVVERLRGFAVLRLVPLGGRSHQVRAHLAALGHPALGDALHGEDDRLRLSELKIDYRPKRGRPERPLIARPALHAERFVWGDVDLRAPLPDDLEVLLAQLRRLRPLE